MGDKSEISWTEATWNPVTGCTKVSEACTHCYIDRTPPFRMAHRKFVNGHIPLVFHPDRLDKPFKWKKPRKIFVNSLSDLFHKDVPDKFIVDVCATMYDAHWHTFQLLTKRPGRMQSLFSDPRFPWAVGCRAWSRMPPEKAAIVTREEIIGDVKALWPLPNVWVGVTAENQKRADERIPVLVQTPAAVRFISAEPLLGPVQVPLLDQLHWVIAGGESGPNARPIHPEWARSLRNQCQAVGVPFHFKQWGEWQPIDQMPTFDHLYRSNRIAKEHEDQVNIDDSYGRSCIVPELILRADGHHKALTDDGAFRSDRPGWPAVHAFLVGKHKSGRMLDGRTWDEFPLVNVTEGVAP